MSGGADFSVLSLLQPDLLTTKELIDMLKLRCFRMENFSSMPRDRLLELFRQVLLPLPQRSYRANRRGTMLTLARRAKAGSGGEGGGGAGTKNAEGCGISHFGNRLKPPPNSSSSPKIRINSNQGNSDNLNEIVINDRRKSGQIPDGEKEISPKKVKLKRSWEVDSSQQTTSVSPGKKQRKAIEWP